MKHRRPRTDGIIDRSQTDWYRDAAIAAGQPMDKFDDCAKASAKDFVDTAKSGGLVPSAAHGMAIAPATEGAIKDVVSQFWNDDKVSVADAMKKIAAAAKTK